MNATSTLAPGKGLSRLWAPWFVLGLALFVTVLVTLYVAASTRENDQMRFERRVAEATRDVEDRMATYVALLRGLGGLYSAHPQVTQDEFRRYVQRLKLDEEYAGIQGMGFAATVPTEYLDDIDAWISRYRDDQIEIWPELPLEPSPDLSDALQRCVLLYLEPEDQRNRRALGFNISVESTRREAMERARDQGVSAVSGRVGLLQADDPTEEAGFIMFMPVYEGGDTPLTVGERRARLIGFVYSPFRAADLFAHTLDAQTRAGTTVHIYDTAGTNPADLMFRTPRDPSVPANFKPQFRQTVSIQVAGRPWTLVFESEPAFEAQSFSGMLVPFSLLSGLMISLMLFGVTLIQARAHEQSELAAEELRRSESALRQSEARLQMAMAAADLFAVTLDLATDRLTCVGDVRRILGDEPATGADLTALIHPDDRLRFERSIARAMAGEAPHEVECRVIKPDGSIAWLRDRAVVETGPDGNPHRLVGICADVTHQKLVEHQLRSLNETLEQRVADRTLETEQRSAQLRALASELTQAEQRERRRLAQVLHDHLQQLLVAAMMRMAPIRKKAPEELDELLHQVEDLIRQSIASSRSLTIELSPPVLYDAGLCKGLEWLARSMREKHHLEIDLHCDPEAEPGGEDLRAFLFQAVRELLFNIVKHSQTQQARVELGMAGGDRIRIVVEDHGKGFDPAVLRVRGAAAEHFGLFSVQQRLELLGGEMQVQSPLPDSTHGARITLIAPRDHGAGDSPHVSQILSDLPESEEYSAAEKLLENYAAPRRDE